MLGKPAQSPVTTLRLKFFEHRALYGKSLERGQLATVKALPNLESLWLMVMTRFDEANIAENWDMIKYHCGYPMMNDRRAWEKKVRMQVYYVRPDITVKFEYLWKWGVGYYRTLLHWCTWELYITLWYLYPHATLVDNLLIDVYFSAVFQYLDEAILQLSIRRVYKSQFAAAPSKSVEMMLLPRNDHKLSMLQTCSGL
jgi:hypothetical protein